MKTKRLITFAAGLFAALLAYSQISVNAPRLVNSDEQFNITFSMTEKPDNFEWSAGDGFQVVWGPQKGSSTSVSIVNGTKSVNSSYTFTYILVPSAIGTFSLPAAHAVVDGRDVYSRTPKIEVVGSEPQTGAQNGAQAGNQTDGQQQAQQSSPQDGQTGQSSSGGQTSSRQSPASDVFMSLSLSRKNVVKGEPITATLKLYVRGNVSGIEDAKFPTFNGFWSKETAVPQQISFQRENVGGKIYDAALLRQWVLIPQIAGELKIESSELTLTLAQRVSTGNSVFDSFFDDYKNVRKRVATPAMKVAVSELPAGAPASFTGAVGVYTMQASLTRDSLAVNDATSLVIKVTGKGNVSLIGNPKVQFPPDSEVYDVKTTENTDGGSGGTSGTKTFEYPFIPRSHGDFTIPAIEFSYYDISQRRYVTLTAPSLPYHVEQGDPSAYQSSGINGIVSGQTPVSVKNLSEDIRYITTKLPSMRENYSPLASRAVHWVVYVIIAIFALAFYLIANRLREIRSDVALVKTRGASKLARKRLASARSFMERSLYSAFYEELHKALLGYASDKLNIQAVDLSREGIRNAFRQAGAPEAIINDYENLLEECEIARFSPEEGGEKMQQSYHKALDTITSIDSNMKKDRNSKAAAAVLLAVLLFSGLGPQKIQAQEQEETLPPVDTVWNSAVQAYGAGQYAIAAELFTSIEKRGLSSCELLTNIGNAHFKSGSKALAILYYERALRADPSYKDARYNLDIVNSQIQDKIESVPELFIKKWLRNFCFIMGMDAWVITGWVIFAVFAVLLLIFLLGRTSLARRIGFFGAIIALLLTVCCVINANSQKDLSMERSSAVVFPGVSAVKGSPSQSGNDQFLLHEGTKVKILDTVQDWTRISIADGRQGWIKTGDIIVI